jgi:hypothetical protein
MSMDLRDRYDVDPGPYKEDFEEPWEVDTWGDLLKRLQGLTPEQLEQAVNIRATVSKTLVHGNGATTTYKAQEVLQGYHLVAISGAQHVK